MTDYCSGGDLYEYLKSRKRRIDEDLVIEWLVQIALALEFLHAKKVRTRISIRVRECNITEDASSMSVPLYNV